MKYERVKCERCAGTGRVKMGTASHVIGSNRRRRPSCPDCSGRGYVDVRVKEDAPKCHCADGHRLPVWHCPVHGDVVVDT